MPLIFPAYLITGVNIPGSGHPYLIFDFTADMLLCYIAMHNLGLKPEADMLYQIKDLPVYSTTLKLLS